jgi:hypothetical protein
MMSSCETCHLPCETLSPLPAAGVCPQAPLSFGPSQGPRPRRTPEALTAPILSGMSRPRYAALRRAPLQQDAAAGGGGRWPRRGEKMALYFLSSLYALPKKWDEPIDPMGKDYNIRVLAGSPRAKATAGSRLIARPAAHATANASSPRAARASASSRS